MATINRRLKIVVRSSPTLYHGAKTAQSAVLAVRRTRWRLQRRAIFHRYVETHHVRKLELGAGQYAADGWLRTDLDPTVSRAGSSAGPLLFLDATARFPFPDETFDYIRSEHMIEHLSFEGARAMVDECFRVLRTNGCLRIATPDLAHLLALYINREDLNSEQAAYVSWVASELMGDERRATPLFVLNNAFRAWGHTFLFDEDTLTEALHEAGFREVHRVAVGESDDPELAGSERHALAVENAAANEFETMVLEAWKLP